MNAPYLLIPLVLAHKLMSKGSGKTTKRRTKKHRRRQQKFAPLSLLQVTVLGVTHAGMVVLHIVRTMGVLKSEASISKQWVRDFEPVLKQSDGMNVILIQTLQSFFYLIPYHMLSIWEIWTRVRYHRRGLIGNANDWSALVLGMYSQASFIQYFMTIATYKSPGEIEYNQHFNTLYVTLCVEAIALYHASQN